MYENGICMGNCSGDGSTIGGPRKEHSQETFYITGEAKQHERSQPWIIKTF